MATPTIDFEIRTIEDFKGSRWACAGTFQKLLSKLKFSAFVKSILNYFKKASPPPEYKLTDLFLLLYVRIITSKVGGAQKFARAYARAIL